MSEKAARTWRTIWDHQMTKDGSRRFTQDFIYSVILNYLTFW